MIRAHISVYCQEDPLTIRDRIKHFGKSESCIIESVWLLSGSPEIQVVAVVDSAVALRELIEKIEKLHYVEKTFFQEIISH
jgi:hypothetical protein